MNDNFKEAFEKTRLAGVIAAGALDEVSKIIKPGLGQMKLMIYVMNILMIILLTLLLYFIEVSQDLAVHQ